MKLERIYRSAVELGITKDPRGKEGVRQALEDSRKEYEGLKGTRKRYFDKERLTNPFSDTRILHGKGDLEVKSVIAGIDVEAPEIILVDRLRQSGNKIDLCIAHHPEGRALAALADVMLSLIHISEPTRLGMISYAVFCLQTKKETKQGTVRPP